MHVAQRHPSIKGCRDECVVQRMRANCLGDFRTTGAPPNNSAGPGIKSPTVCRDEDRTVVTFSDGQIHGPGGTRSIGMVTVLPSLRRMVSVR